MINLKAKLGLSAAATVFAGGVAVYGYIRAKAEKAKIPPELPKIPTHLEEAAPDVIYNEKPTPEKLKSRSSSLKLATDSVRSALRLAVLEVKTLAVHGAALVLASRFFATSTEVKSGEQKSSPFTPRWIISQKDDLIYLIGSVGVSLAFIFATFVLKVDSMLLWWVWALILDGPHVWGTATRTYFDKQELHNRKRLLAGSLLWFGLGAGLATVNISIFRSFAYTWAYYHLVKQHYGFMILYKKKNQDLAKFDNVIDKAMIWVGFGFPFLSAMFKPNAPSLYKSVQQLVPQSLHNKVHPVTLSAFLGTLGVYAARQAYKLTAGLPANLPKHLLLTASIGLHILVMALPYGELANGLLLIVATLTAFHNVQYQRLMWFHNRNKYGKGELKETLKTYGPATFFGRKFSVYLGSGIAFTLFYRPILLKKARGGKYAHALEGFFWGFAFLHYYLDSKIWRVRSDNRLNQALQMGNKAA